MLRGDSTCYHRSVSVAVVKVEVRTLSPVRPWFS